MKRTLLLVMCLMSSTLFCQEVIEGPWKLQCGASLSNYSSFNLRYVSPRFKYSNEEWTEEMEKHPEQYKKARFMVELIYTPPFKILCVGLNLQYRVIKYKRLSWDLYGGMKFILKAPADF